MPFKTTEDKRAYQREFSKRTEAKEKRNARDRAKRRLLKENNQSTQSESQRDYKRNYMREYYSTNVQANLANRLRRRLHKFAGGKKSAPTMKLLGCTIEQLQGHLEAQFIDGMCWNNRDEWDIDHILPCSNFDLRIAEQQRECFHYTNLQPLWKSDNRAKGSQLDWAS